jgi:Tol biopolymer transport system component
MKRRLYCFPLVAACSSAPPPGAAPTAAPPAAALARPGEVRFSELRQLTSGGENAEAYWSFDGRHLIFQAHSGEGCDQIYVLDAFRPERPRLVSTGAGATTCSYFLPGDREIIYASTHLSGAACPPKPDRSRGYVWAIYPSYDIFRSALDASHPPERLTTTAGYDAEATVCSVDGSIVFTSVRDGDLDLYRMDADGKNVRRLTNTPGYDGGAFFDAKCQKLVWRASRPEGAELQEYRVLLTQGLVRPGRLELMVGNADGSEARQVTYLGAAAFAPFFHPSGQRIVFSSNHADPRGREFELWAVDTDGTDLERVTFSPGFDGFPMFSPDGAWLAFASNRANAKGSHDTNLFVARWADAAHASIVETAADRIQRDIAWLAHADREGRGIGTRGLEQAGAFVEERFRSLGLAPAGERGGFRQAFDVTTSVETDASSALALGAAAPLGAQAWQPLPFSAEGEIKAPLILAGYGIRAPELGVDDYAKLDVKGKIAIVRRFVPDDERFAARERKQRYGDLRYKAWVARERGAVGMLIVDMPMRPKGAPATWKPADEAALPSLVPDGYGDAGLPAAIVRREAFLPTLAALERGARVRARLVVKLRKVSTGAFNVLGRLEPHVPEAERLPGLIVLGAHYDHLGFGGPDSLAPGVRAPHLGADDNASGVGVLMEAARALAGGKRSLRRPVLFAAFSGEERGVLGSTHWTRSAGADVKSVIAMLNMDMVGRLRENRLSVLGGESAAEWPALVDAACKQARVTCALGGDGYGPSDQTPFFAAGAPVLHFFTGAHADYHKPSDAPELINAAGAAQVAQIVELVASDLGTRATPPTYRSAPSPAPRGDVRSFNASLGTVPDYAGPPGGEKGVLLAGVRPGSAAERAGLQRGDILVQLGPHAIGDVRDLMFALQALKPGDVVVIAVRRGPKRLELKATLERRAPH